MVLLSRKAESYKDIVDEIKKSGGQAYGISADVTDTVSLDAAFESIKKQLPDSQLAAAIYNVSGTPAKKPFLEVKLDDLEYSLSTTM